VHWMPGNLPPGAEVEAYNEDEPDTKFLSLVSQVPILGILGTDSVFFTFVDPA